MSWLVKRITYRGLAVAMVVLGGISLLPILYCSFFDYATGDDLWEGAEAYRVLVNHGSPGEFFSAIFQWACKDYMGWEGNWSSIILWCLEPSIFGEKFYCITPWIALFFLCGGTGYFLFYFLKKYLAAEASFLLIVSSMACFFSVQYMPYIRGGIFWYTGMVNYVVPYGLCLMAFVWIDKFIETGRRRYCIYTSLAMAYLGGAGYLTIVLAFEILFLAIIINIFSRESKKVHRAKWLLIPFLLLAVGFLFSAVSPGNAKRGGEEYYFSAAKAFVTVLLSIRQGALGGIRWFWTVRPLFLAIPILCVAAWEMIDVDKVKLELKYPVLVAVFLFLISCSVYAPEIYAQSEVSGGVWDTVYFVFLLTLFLGTAYITCCVKKVAIRKKWCLAKPEFWEKLRVYVILGSAMFCIMAARYLIGNMTAYVCIEFARSGQLRDFEEQMQERLEILHDPEIQDVVLPQMNDEQGPFMHMPLTADPGAYTNVATARFYGKRSVTAIPRTEYYERYGYPEKDIK